MTAPTRRRLLAAAGAAAVAGCLQEPGSTGGSPNGGGPDGDEPNGTSGLSSPPGESDPDSCPSYGDRVDRVVCYDDASDAEIYLEPDRRTVSDGESIAFALENGTDERLAINFYDWRIDKHVDDDWFRVAPMAVPEPLMYLDPGASHTWSVTVDQGVPRDGRPVAGGSGTSDLSLEAVGAGTYAFRARGWFEGDSREEAIGFAATFDLRGDRLELAPSDAIAETTWEDDVLVAESTRGDPDGEHQRPGAFELERRVDPDGATSGDDGEPESVITEQLFRHPRLRDAIALSFEHEADRVRLEEYDGTYPIFGFRSDALYEFQGEYYRIEARELEE